jgi:hypothetical protein
MRPPSRKQAIFAAITVVMGLALAAASAPVQSLSTGIDSSAGGVGAPPDRGCYCHSADSSKTPNGRANISFVIEGLNTPSGGGYYAAGKDYPITLTFDDSGVPMNANATANHGGFNVWTNTGTFSTNGSDLVQVNSDGSITHTKKGDVEAMRSFKFVWKSPAASNDTDVTFDILVNAVNGDNVNTGGNDHWSRMIVSLPGKPGASVGGTVDISKLGVPLRAYWLGVIGILSTMFLLVLSFYVIRSGSKFYEFGLPRGQVKQVKIRTIPAPKTRGAYLTMTALVVIEIMIVFTFLGIRDEDLSALQATGFLVAAAMVMVLMAAYYIRAFLPLVDVLEEETVEPLK